MVRSPAGMACTTVAKVPDLRSAPRPDLSGGMGSAYSSAPATQPQATFAGIVFHVAKRRRYATGAPVSSSGFSAARLPLARRAGSNGATPTPQGNAPERAGDGSSDCDAGKRAAAF